MSSDARFSDAPASNRIFSAHSFPRLGDDVSAGFEEKARARGPATGYTDGLRAARSEVEARVRRLEADHAAVVAELRAKHEHAASVLAAATRALDERTVPVLADVHDSLAAAAIELTEAILGYELDDESRGARAARARALPEVDVDLVRVVRMHPDDLALIDTETRARAGVQFTADASLRQGDAVTDFPDGYLDARISTALDRSRNALLRENR
jgi:flagellar assembly protein FliH